MAITEDQGIEVPIRASIELTVERPKEKFSFTKMTMCVIFVMFIVGAIIGGILVVISAIHDMSMDLQIDTGMYIAYATYLGAPTATAVGFYAWKSKAENILKIQQSHAIEEMPAILANMRGVD